MVNSERKPEVQAPKHAIGLSAAVRDVLIDLGSLTVDTELKVPDFEEWVRVAREAGALDHDDFGRFDPRVGKPHYAAVSTPRSVDHPELSYEWDH